MKRPMTCLLAFALFFALAGCTPAENTSGSEAEKPFTNAPEGAVEALYDPEFAFGFNIFGVDSRYHSTSPWYQLKIDESSVEDPIWKIGQWGCFVNYFLDSEKTYLEDGKEFTYPATDAHAQTEGDWKTISNPTSTISVNAKTGSVKLYQDTRQEYGVTPSYCDSPRASLPRKEGEAWPHLIIEQNIVSNTSLGELEGIYFDMGFTLTKCDDYTPDKNTSLHSAQFQWIISIECFNPEKTSYRDYYWFDIPIVDARYGETTYKTDPFANYDGGKEDSTGNLIYGISNYDFIDKGAEVGKENAVSVDLYDAIAQSFVYAQSEGLFTDCTLEDMRIATTNIGWEVTGVYDVGVDISYLSMKYVKEGA